MDRKLNLTVDWHEILAAIEEQGYIVFPKDLIQKLEQERAEWSINKNMMEDYLAAAKQAEAEAKQAEPYSKKNYIITALGCDDKTIINYELTDGEYALVSKIANAITEALTYQCMPMMFVKEGTYTEETDGEDD